MSNSVTPADDGFPQSCTARWRTPDGRLEPLAVCGKPAWREVADTYFCDFHYQRALAWAEKTARWANSIVYYVQRQDRMIKIGTSRSTRSRFGDITREYGQIVLLAFHPGARAEETATHRMFKPLHIGREWFRPELVLLEYIAGIRKGMPNLESDSGMPPRMDRLEFSRLLREARRQVT